MDEPFAALDAQSRELMQAELLRLAGGPEGPTVVFVTHSVDEALVLADRVVLLSPRPGRVVEELAVRFPAPRWRARPAAGGGVPAAAGAPLGAAADDGALGPRIGLLRRRRTRGRRMTSRLLSQLGGPPRPHRPQPQGPGLRQRPRPPAPWRPEGRRLPRPEPPGSRSRPRGRRAGADPVAGDRRVARRDLPRAAAAPADMDTRARARAFAQVIACDVHPLQNLRVLRYLKGRLGQDQDGLDAWCRHWVGEGLAACEALLGREPAATFAFGDAPGSPMPRAADALGRAVRRRPGAHAAAPRPARPLPPAGLRRGGIRRAARFRARRPTLVLRRAVEPFRRASTRACNAAFHALSAIGAVFSRRTSSLLSAFT